MLLSSVAMLCLLSGRHAGELVHQPVAVPVVPADVGVLVRGRHFGGLAGEGDAPHAVHLDVGVHGERRRALLLLGEQHRGRAGVHLDGVAAHEASNVFTASALLKRATRRYFEVPHHGGLAYI